MPQSTPDRLIESALKHLEAYGRDGLAGPIHETVSNVIQDIIDSAVNSSEPSVQNQQTNNPFGVPADKWFVKAMTTRVGGMGGGTSQRLGNIRLNLPKAYSAVLSAGITYKAASVVPWIAILAILRAISDVSVATKIELSEIESAIAWTLWQVANPENKESQMDLLDAANLNFETHGRPHISQIQLNDALSKLEEVHFIRTLPDGSWAISEILFFYHE